MLLPGGGALECNLTDRSQESPQPVKEKNAFRYPVLELLDYKRFHEQ